MLSETTLCARDSWQGFQLFLQTHKTCPGSWNSHVPILQRSGMKCGRWRDPHNPRQLGSMGARRRTPAGWPLSRGSYLTPPQSWMVSWTFRGRDFKPPFLYWGPVAWRHAHTKPFLRLMCSQWRKSGTACLDDSEHWSASQKLDSLLRDALLPCLYWPASTPQFQSPEEVLYCFAFLTTSSSVCPSSSPPPSPPPPPHFSFLLLLLQALYHWVIPSASL